RYGRLMFVTRNIFYYDRQILCPHMYSRTCHLVRCASSITRPGRIAARITRTSGERCVGLTPGRESCIALTRRVADGFAQSKTDSQESESGGETASGCKPSRARNRESHESAGTRRWSWLGMG